jgi:hypothetical protein
MSIGPRPFTPKPSALEILFRFADDEELANYLKLHLPILVQQDTFREFFGAMISRKPDLFSLALSRVCFPKTQADIWQKESKRYEARERHRVQAERCALELASCGILLGHYFALHRTTPGTLHGMDVVGAVDRTFVLRYNSPGRWGFYFVSKQLNSGGPKDLFVDFGHVVFVMNMKRKGLSDVYVQSIFKFLMPILTCDFVYPDFATTECIYHVKNYWSQKNEESRNLLHEQNI